MDGRDRVCGCFRRTKQCPRASLEEATKDGDSMPHTPGAGTAMGPVVGSGWGHGTEGTWLDLQAVFTPVPYMCEVFADTALFDTMVFGPILQLRRLKP